MNRREQLIRAGLWNADDPRDPSQSDAAALDVLKAMEAQGYETFRAVYDDQWWTVTFDDKWDYCGHSKKSLADAITTAAIRAIEADESQKEERNEQ
ncbi:MAG: hypothetical protein WC718_18160 [Phycisphaerales bacterium]|jgi:hypothetical protein